MVDRTPEAADRGQQADPAGYLHPSYARSLSQFGRPRQLPASGGWILERDIPGSDYRDAMGCYPLFACRDWSRLCSDLEVAGSGLVSLTLVTDPFAEREVAGLRRCFNRVERFKDHLVVELSRPAVERTTRHHRYYARRALRRGVTVERCDEPMRLLDEWMRLYGVLVERHDLSGLKRFSKKAFSEQLAAPGAVMFRALERGVTVAAHIWYVQGELAHSHLQATDQRGYDVRAAYALYSEALDWLAARCSFADLGAAAGAKREREDGLSHFKRGWATETRATYLCLRVFDPDAYQELARSAGSRGTDYLPAYRAGELV